MNEPLRITDEDVDPEALPAPEDHDEAIAIAVRLFPPAADPFADDDLVARMDYAENCHYLAVHRLAQRPYDGDLAAERDCTWWHLMGEAICPEEITVLMEFEDAWIAHDPFGDPTQVWGPPRNSMLRWCTDAVIELQPSTLLQFAWKVLIIARVGLARRLKRDPDALEAVRCEHDRLVELPLRIVAGAVDSRFLPESVLGHDPEEQLVRDAVSDAGPMARRAIEADAKFIRDHCTSL